MYLMEQLYTIGRNEAVAVIIENSKEVLPKLKNRIITWSSNSTPEYITGKKNENANLKIYRHLNVESNTNYNSQDMEAIQCSSTY